MFYFLIDFYCFMKTEKKSALFRCLCTWLCTFLSDFIFVPAKQIVFRKYAAKVTEAVLELAHQGFTFTVSAMHSKGPN